MTSISAAFRSIWHTMTSNDRHATIDSPYRTGRHVPLESNRNTLTSITTASESRADFHSPYTDESGRHSSSPPEGHVPAFSSPYAPTNSPPSRPSRPYSPGLRSAAAATAGRRSSQETQGEIPMQAFEDGIAPPPPPSHSWKKIDEWAEENYPELFDQLCEGATNNDINDLEHQLDCSLPQDVRESLMVHDGQERGGMPTGIVFGSMLLDCEEIVQEWENWRTVNRELLAEANFAKPAVPSKALGGNVGASSSRAPPSPASAASAQPSWRQELLSRQDCVPPYAVRKSYAHPAWIPLVRDWGGNMLAVDLAPGPQGRWGQVIIFGRDYDTKYVVARSWAAFLALIADDLNSNKWFVDEDTQELKLREFKETRVEPAYFNILRWRMDQKHGRRASKRLSSSPNVLPPPGTPGRALSPASSHRSVSPYASPVEPPVRSPLSSSSRPGFPSPSPLSRVTEEAGVVGNNGSSNKESTIKPTTGTTGPAPDLSAEAKPKTPKLVEVGTPRPSDDVNPLRLSGLASPQSEKESPLVTPPADPQSDDNSNPLLVGVTYEKAGGDRIEEPLRTIEI